MTDANAATAFLARVEQTEKDYNAGANTPIDQLAVDQMNLFLEAVPKMRRALQAILTFCSALEPSESTDFDYGWNAALKSINEILERELSWEVRA